MAQHDSTTPVSERDSWSTPQFIVDWLKSLYPIDIDLCASPSNAKCEKYLTKEMEALTMEWSQFGSFGFCNPPYSNIKPWIDKAVKEKDKGFTTVMLIPTPNGESYYHDVFRHASDIIFITGRLSFLDSNFNPKGGNTRGSCVVIFSKLPPLQLELKNANRGDLIKEFSK